MYKKFQISIIDLNNVAQSIAYTIEHGNEQINSSMFM